MRMNLKIAIVDDEPACRDFLRCILQRDFPGICVLGEASSVAEGLVLLQQVKPDLLLLDVQMEDGTGFDLLDQLPHINFSVVFTTAHDAFAIRAFRYNAIDYLLKPVDPEELASALHKAQQHGAAHAMKPQIEYLLSTTSSKRFDRMALPTSSGLVFVSLEDVMHIESYGNYSFVFTVAGERILASRNLKEFEEMLPYPPFFRTHQSHIIHTAYVERYLKAGEVAAVLRNGVSVPVARRKKDAFEEILLNAKENQANAKRQVE